MMQSPLLENFIMLKGYSLTEVLFILKSTSI